MIEALQNMAAADDDLVAAEQIPFALTAGDLVYDDGATQVFDASGATTYVEHGREMHRQWSVDDQGRFCSFWPPSYQACYSLRWIVEGGNVVGLRFTELQGRSSFDGRYR